MDEPDVILPAPKPMPGGDGDAGQAPRLPPDAPAGGAPSPHQGKRITESDVAGLFGAMPSTGKHAPRHWHPPTVEELQSLLPQYEITAFLARGGMGAVYKGVQKSLGRPVAVKILPPDIEDDDVHYAERFRREAQSMGRLTHPNIVAVYEAGETPEGLLYFVMEFIEGTDVQQLIAGEGRLDPRRALSITSAVCDALAFAHEEGIIHRDIKPSNIMLDKKGRVKVADFGLAKTVNLESTMLTRSDVTMGTPDFVAPEVLIPGMTVDGRADLYGVGVMFYQMLTGKIPRGRFALPSGVNPQIDPRLDAIVDKAMQTEREKRYSTAIEMKTDVEKVVAGFGPSGSAGMTRAGSATRPGLKLKTTLLILAAAVIALAAFFVLTKSNSQPARPKQSAVSPSPNLPVSQSSTSTATQDAPFINTLGMKFVPVPITGGPTGGQRVLFSVWETRVQDFEVFAKEKVLRWPKPFFPIEPTHPAAGVSWEDATAFCVWLTERERKAGKLGASERYRLPSDHEWSCAVGIGDREDASKLPSEKSSKLADVFPWGSVWPPSIGVGNYAGEELQPALAAKKYSYINGLLAGYRDGHVEVAPVGSFPASSLGLHDLSGNVWEWCEDWFDATQKDRLFRGGSWTSSDRGSLLSSDRHHYTPAIRSNNFGFRCVLAGSAR